MSFGLDTSKPLWKLFIAKAFVRDSDFLYSLSQGWKVLNWQSTNSVVSKGEKSSIIMKGQCNGDFSDHFALPLLLHRCTETESSLLTGHGNVMIALINDKKWVSMFPVHIYFDNAIHWMPANGHSALKSGNKIYNMIVSFKMGGSNVNEMWFTIKGLQDEKCWLHPLWQGQCMPVFAGNKLHTEPRIHHFYITFWQKGRGLIVMNTHYQIILCF